MGKIAPLLPILLLLLAAPALAQPNPAQPDWEEGTYWISHRYSDQIVLSYTENNIIHSYVWDSFCRQDPTHLTYLHSNFTISRISFPEKNQGLATTLPLINFPLYQGKAWNATWAVQKTPGGLIFKYPVTVQVIGAEPFNYYNIQTAYLLNITLNNTIDLLFHYVPQNSTFPGQPPMEVYEEIESGQPFRLLEYGVSENPGVHLADMHRSQICPSESVLQFIFQKIASFLTRLLQLHPF